MWDHLLTHSLLGTSELEEARGISIWRTGWKTAGWFIQKKGCRGRFFKFVPESTFHTYSWKKELFGPLIWKYVCICMFIVHQMYSIQFAAGHLLDREDFWWKKKLHFLQQSEAKNESFYSHISWSDSFFASFVLGQGPLPLLEDWYGSLNYWFRSSRRRKRM